MGNATVWNCGFAKSVPKVLRKWFPQFSYGASQSSRILVSPIATPINTCCAAQGSKLAMPLPHTQTEEAEGSWRSCPSGPGHESLRSWIKQQQWGEGEQFQYNVPRALFPSLRTWCDSEGSQVPSCRAGRAQLPPWVVGNNDVPIQAGFASGLHFPKGFWRQVGRQTGRTSLRRQMSSRVPQAKAPMVCPGLPHPCEVASPSGSPVL